MSWPTVTVAAGTNANPVGIPGSISWSHTVSSGQTLLIVLVGQGNPGAADGVTGVTWNGASMSLKAGTNLTDGIFCRAQTWELADPTPATGNVVVSFNASTRQISGGSISFDGASTTTKTVSSATQVLGQSNPAVTVADTASGDIVVSLVVTDHQLSATNPATGTVINDSEDVGADTDHNSQYQTATGANTVCSWSNTDTASSGNTIAIGYAVASGAIAPVITSQPADQAVVNGATATFSVTATGATSYQWQDDSSGSFVDIGGATSASYTTEATTSSFQRRGYRCNVTNAAGTTTSSAATLRLQWFDIYLYDMPEDSNPSDVRLRDPTTSGGPAVTSSSGVSAATGQASSPTSPTIAVAAASAATGQAASPTQSPVVAVSAPAAQATSPTQSPATAVSAASAQATAPTQSPVSAVSAAASQAAAPGEEAGGAPTTSAAVSVGGSQAAAPVNATFAVEAVSASSSQASAPTQSPVAAVAASTGQAAAPGQDGSTAPTTSDAVSAGGGQAAAPVNATATSSATAGAVGQAASPALQIVILSSDGISAAVGQATAGVPPDPTTEQVESIGSYGTVGLGPFAPRVHALARIALAVAVPPQIERPRRSKPQTLADVIAPSVHAILIRRPEAFAVEPVAKPLRGADLIRSPRAQLIRSHNRATEPTY